MVLLVRNCASVHADAYASLYCIAIQPYLKVFACGVMALEQVQIAAVLELSLLVYCKGITGGLLVQLSLNVGFNKQIAVRASPSVAGVLRIGVQNVVPVEDRVVHRDERLHALRSERPEEQTAAGLRGIELHATRLAQDPALQEASTVQWCESAGNRLWCCTPQHMSQNL